MNKSNPFYPFYGLRQWVAHVAFSVFLWALEYKNVDEFYAEVLENARREYQSDKDSAWFTL